MQRFPHIEHSLLQYFSNGWRIANAINELEKVRNGKKTGYALEDFYEYVGKYIAYSLYYSKEGSNIDWIKNSEEVCFINDLIWPNLEDLIYHQEGREILNKMDEIAITSITTIEKVLAGQEVVEDSINSAIDYFQGLSNRCLPSYPRCPGH